MRAYDFAPLSRSSIGFDRIFDLLNENAQRLENREEFPPYDIVRTGEDTYRISLALSGFAPEEISVVIHQNQLAVSGKRTATPGHDYLHRGINSGSFERQFSLADHIEVEGAAMVNGLLQIDLVRRTPEAMKPRRIPIGLGTPAPKPAKNKAGEPGRNAS